jgi:hypothetical protein
MDQTLHGARDGHDQIIPQKYADLKFYDTLIIFLIRCIFCFYRPVTFDPRFTKPTCSFKVELTLVYGLLGAYVL